MSSFDLETVQALVLKYKVELALFAVAAILILFAFRPRKTAPAKAPLTWPDFQKYPLVHKEKVNHNTNLYRFALPNKDDVLNLPTGKHVQLRCEIDGEQVMRSYTPVRQGTQGHVDLVIKVYPPPAKMSQFVDNLRIGETIEMRGPKGTFNYSPNMKRAIGMIAGGSGITPMLQIAQQTLADPTEKTKLSLIFANIAEEDILLKDMLDELAKTHSNRFSVYYVLEKPPSNWKGGVGYTTPDMIKANLPAPQDDVLILNCGPPPMLNAMKKNLASLNYTDDMQFYF